MIVQCPHCSDRYRVNEQNIPSTGGRIRCPSCSSTFVVYPTAAAPQAPAPASYDAEKTSVATNIGDLMGGFGAPKAAPEEEDSATEVISGDSLPSFLGGLAGGFSGGSDSVEEDGTVEMENPLLLADAHGWGQGNAAAAERSVPEPYDATEIVSADEAAQILGSSGIPQQASIARPPVPNPFGGGGRAQSGGYPAQPQPPSFQSPFGGSSAAPQPYQPAPVAQQQPQVPSPQQPMQPPVQPAMQPPSQQPAMPQAPALQPPTQGPNAGHGGPWKLKTNYGLTYEFPDTRGLVEWLVKRDDFEGYTLSGGDDDFHPLTDFPQIAPHVQGGGVPAASETPSFQGGGFGGAPPRAAGGFGQAPQPGFGQPPHHNAPQGGARTQRPVHNTSPPQMVNMQHTELPSRDAKWNKVLWVVFLGLFVGCSLLAAQIANLVDFKELLGLSPVTQQQEPPAVTEPDPTPPSPGQEEAAQDSTPKLGLSPEQAAEVDKLVSEAREEIEMNKFASAKSKLEIAKDLDPQRFVVYDLLARVYEEIGDDKKAKATRMEVQALRAKQDTVEEEPE